MCAAPVKVSTKSTKYKLFIVVILCEEARLFEEKVMVVCIILRCDFERVIGAFQKKILAWL